MSLQAELDHLVVAADTLEQGADFVERILGIRPQPGGQHKPMGTHNLVLSLGERCYLEVIAIDPDLPKPERPRWFGLDGSNLHQRLRARPRLIHWVARTPDLDKSVAAAPLGEILGNGQVAGPDASLLTQPSRAIFQALERAGKTVADVDLFELNEAFAAVGVASMKELGITDEIVNVNGGAIALGHPIGMSGTRIVLTVLNELQRRGGGVGAAALCGGGGQGDALVVRTLS